MLSRFHRLARWLAPWRRVVMAAIFVSAASVVYALVSRGTTTTGPLIPSLLCTLWLLLLLAFIELFRQVPRPPSRGDKFFLRMSLKLKRGFYWLLALVVAGVTALVTGLSVKLLMQLFS
jgi:hypothetical protein